VDTAPGHRVRAFFDLERHGTDVRTEILAGVTTFLTMAYVTVVNPSILAEAGMDFGSVFVATCVAAALGTALMGLLANYPIALAPGMGLNAYFAYSVVQGLGCDWPVALGAVFVSGVLFLILSVLPVRRWLIHSIPHTLKLAISAGIGLFLALIALQNAGIVIAHPVTLVTLSDLREPGALLALTGFAAIAALERRGVPGAILLGVLGVTVLGLALGVSEWKGLASLPPSPAPTLLALDVGGALTLELASVVFAFLFIDLFDTAGTLVGVGHRAGLLDEHGHLPRLGRALVADSTATVAGALLGTSTTTSYIESAAGVNAGGRTGLSALTVSLLFLLSLFFAPLAQTVPGYATAPALLFVACMMARGLAELDWEDPTEYGPAVVTAIAMPLTYSIADGIGLGLISFAGAKLLSGRYSQCPPAVWVIAALFGLRFAFL
jgi:AGZA family xanthine/uracil permease-like MFS transporter